MKYDIVVAKPDESTAISGLYNRVYDGNYPRQEFNSPEGIQKLINSDRIYFLVAKSKEEVVASFAADLDPNNKAFEFGRLVVDPKHRKNNLGGSLFFATIDYCFSKPEMWHLAWATVRTDDIFNFMNRNCTPTGYTLEHTVDEREGHLIFSKYNPKSQFNRLVPVGFQNMALYKGSIYQEIQQRKILRDEIEGNYPQAIIPESQGEHTVKAGDYILHYSINRTENSTIIHNISDPESIQPHGFRMSLESFLEFVKTEGVENTQVNILSDKTDFIKASEDCGFDITALTPGGMFVDGKRFDTVTLQLTTSPQITMDEKIRRTIEMMKNEGFRG